MNTHFAVRILRFVSLKKEIEKYFFSFCFVSIHSFIVDWWQQREPKQCVNSVGIRFKSLREQVLHYRPSYRVNRTTTEWNATLARVMRAKYNGSNNIIATRVSLSTFNSYQSFRVHFFSFNFKLQRVQRRSSGAPETINSIHSQRNVN